MRSDINLATTGGVLSEAGWHHFDYAAHLQRAQQHDLSSLVALIQFSVHTDGEGAIEHGSVLLRLRSLLGRRAFNAALDRATAEVRSRALHSMNTAADLQRRAKVA